MSWWMRHYGSESPKRHVMFANTPWISRLSLGRLFGWKAEINKGTKPCRSYISKDGKRRFHGTRFLKRTELLVEVKEMGLTLLHFSCPAQCWATITRTHIL